MKFNFLNPLALALVLGFGAQSQVLFSLDGREDVSAAEFEAVYNKNRDIGEQIDPKTPGEYLELYINFKLKVLEAKDLNMHYRPEFLDEFYGYRDQLAKPYLTDKSAEESLIQEALNRMQFDVKASHIMIGTKSQDPKDTLEAYLKLENIRELIVTGKKSFEEMATEYSEDSYSAAKKGSLGYFTAFGMVYPFESAAYALKLGEISPIVRTQFGYHIIRLDDKRPARGRLKAAHIMLISNDASTQQQKADAEIRIKEIHQRLKSGESDFNTLVKQFSEDKSSVSKNGELAEFGMNEMVEEFENAAFALQNPGDYSEPIKTSFGWHIVKLIEKKPDLSSDEKLNIVKRKIQRDQRGQISQENFIVKLKKEYNYKEVPKAISRLVKLIPEDAKKGNWEAPESLLRDETVLATFGDAQIETRHLVDFIEMSNGQASENYPMNQFVRDYLNAHADERLLIHERNNLENKYPEYKLLLNEYRDGILLFDLTQQKVWDKSLKDTVGLESFFEQNRDKYRWQKRFRYVLYNAQDAKTAKKAFKAARKGMDREELVKKLNEKSSLALQVTDAFTETPETWMNNVSAVGLTEVHEVNGRYVFADLKEIVQEGPKEMEECKGLVVSDYQQFLEKEWLRELRTKYAVRVDELVKADLFNKLNP